jgi:hypothetical protein
VQHQTLRLQGDCGELVDLYGKVLDIDPSVSRIRPYFS